MREYTYYYAPKTVNTLITDENDLSISTKVIYFGTSLKKQRLV